MNFRKDSIKTYYSDPFYFVSWPEYTYHIILYGSKQDMEKFGDKYLYLLVEKGLRENLYGVHGPNYFESDGEGKHTHDDFNNFLGWAMTHPLSYGEIEMDWNFYFESTLETADDAEFGYLVELNLIYLDGIISKTIFFRFVRI